MGTNSDTAAAVEMPESFALHKAGFKSFANEVFVQVASNEDHSALSLLVWAPGSVKICCEVQMHALQVPQGGKGSLVTLDGSHT